MRQKTLRLSFHLPGPREPFKRDTTSRQGATEWTGGVYSQQNSDTAFRPRFHSGRNSSFWWFSLLGYFMISPAQKRLFSQTRIYNFFKPVSRKSDQLLKKKTSIWLGWHILIWPGKKTMCGFNHSNLTYPPPPLMQSIKKIIR